MSNDTRPIGVFDSGVGGLTVLRALKTQLPHEHTIYLGDTARVPYGTKSPEVVIRYAVTSAEFLRKRGIKLLVVACNTASAVALPALAAHLPIPVVGVIEPGAAAAIHASATKRVAVVGTPGTIASHAYQRALESLAPGLFVWARACPLLVPLAEEGWTEGEVPELVVRRYLSDLPQAKVDTLVLGCTHYPLLKETLAKVVGASVRLVDSADATAAAVAKLLETGKVGRAAAAETTAAGTATAASGESEFFVTDVPSGFIRVAERFLGARVSAAEQVDLIP